MTFRDVLQTTVRAFTANRLRAGLSVLGIIIGVGSVLLLVAIGHGVRADIARHVEALGTNVLFVLPGKLDPSGQPNGMSLMGLSTLTAVDAQSIATIAGVRQAVPIMFVFGSVEHEGQSHSSIVIAADSRMHAIRRQGIAEGRFYSAAEDDRRACVIGHDVRTEVYGLGPALGQALSVRGVSFRVIGVLAAEEPTLFSQGSFSRVVYLPWRASAKAFGTAQVNRIIVQTDYRTDPDTIVETVRSVLLKNHGRDDFGVLTHRQLLGAIFRVFNIITALIVGISTISLLVAGIGIMNIMLVTVTERTREIGIRMTVGARRRDVFLQFLAESVALSLAGGTLGIGLAWAAARLIAAYSVLQPLVTAGAVGLAFGVCFAVGVLFGTAPAARAAHQDPIEALRWE